MDKSGDPIYYLVTEQNLPEVPSATVLDVYDTVKQAVETYYEHNAIRGCTKENAPNFNFLANLDDGSCHPTKTNFTFGGVYQKCHNQGVDNLCAKMTQTNPQTGTYSCPSGYEAVPIRSGSKKSSRSERKCHRCWLFFHCCHTERYSSSATYTAYWCAATRKVSQNSGFLFGGLYTEQVENMVTQRKTCPLKFYPLTILSNLRVCVSDDYELGYQFSIPFAGFFSCDVGNPLALKERSNLLKSSVLNSYMLSKGVESYPHTCPYGYSQHLAYMDNGCNIEYCAKTGSLSALGLPKVKRPPFMETPRSMYSLTESDFVVDDDGILWTDMQKADKIMPKYLQNLGFQSPSSISPFTLNEDSRPQSEESGNSGLAEGAIIGIAVGTTLVCLAMGTLIFLRFRRGKRRYREADPWNNPGETTRIVPRTRADMATVVTRT